MSRLLVVRGKGRGCIGSLNLSRDERSHAHVKLQVWCRNIESVEGRSRLERSGTHTLVGSILLERTLPSTDS